MREKRGNRRGWTGDAGSSSNADTRPRTCISCTTGGATTTGATSITGSGSTSTKRTRAPRDPDRREPVGFSRRTAARLAAGLSLREDHEPQGLSVRAIPRLGRSPAVAIFPHRGTAGPIRPCPRTRHRSERGRARPVVPGRAAVRSLGDAGHSLSPTRNASRDSGRLCPKLEAVLLSGDEDAVARLVRDEPAGIAEERRRYLMTEVARRDRDLVEQLREIYRRVPDMRLGAAPEVRDRTMRGPSRPLAQPRGQRRSGNLVLTCPNHHRAIHRWMRRSTSLATRSFSAP